MKRKPTREMIKPHIEVLLLDVSLNKFTVSEKEFNTFQTDEIEYLRGKHDYSEEYSIKKQLAALVTTIC